MSQQTKDTASNEHKPKRETRKTKCSMETNRLTARVGAAGAEKPATQEQNRDEHNEAMTDCNGERLPEVYSRRPKTAMSQIMTAKAKLVSQRTL